MKFFRFRTRSADRDRQSDAKRLGGVVKAVQSALESARDEHDGLKRRYELCQADAAFLYDDQDSQDEKRLHELEIQLHAAGSRLRSLTAQIGQLEALLSSAKRLAEGSEERQG